MLVLKVSIVDEEAQSTEGHDENWNRNDDDDDDAKNWRNFLYILFFGTCRHDGHEHVLEEIAKLCPPLQQSPISLSYNCFCAYSKEGQRGFFVETSTEIFRTFLILLLLKSTFQIQNWYISFYLSPFVIYEELWLDLRQVQLGIFKPKRLNRDWAWKGKQLLCSQNMFV